MVLRSKIMGKKTKLERERKIVEHLKIIQNPGP
jgi:hypothetical protein